MRQGQVLVRLDAPELTAQRAEADAKVQSAQAQLAAAQAKLAADNSTYTRMKTASNTPGVVAGNDLEVLAQTLEADRAQVNAQQQLVAAANDARQSTIEILNYLDIKAFDGPSPSATSTRARGSRRVEPAEPIRCFASKRNRSCD